MKDKINKHNCMAKNYLFKLMAIFCDKKTESLKTNSQLFWFVFKLYKVATDKDALSACDYQSNIMKSRYFTMCAVIWLSIAYEMPYLR